MPLWGPISFSRFFDSTLQFDISKIGTSELGFFLSAAFAEDEIEYQLKLKEPRNLDTLGDGPTLSFQLRYLKELSVFLLLFELNNERGIASRHRSARSPADSVQFL